MQVDDVCFFPDGSDERQFCSPGFNMPIGLIMRKMWNASGGWISDLPDNHKFKEYHTSLDDPKKISFKTIIETIKIYYDVLLTIENNFIPIGKIHYGTPQLSKSKIPLYRSKMNWKLKGMDERTKSMLQILNLADGRADFARKNIVNLTK